jgi:2-oxoglutarate ferredoxin oxidoreductase subunit beta
VQLALGAGATFVARTYDADPHHMQATLARAAAHKGSAFIEIMQNCVVFNDGAWSHITDKAVRDERMIKLEHGKPVTYAKGTKGIRLNGFHPEPVTLGENGITEKDLVVWDEKAEGAARAFLFSQMMPPAAPWPVGVFRAVEQPAYHELDRAQKDEVSNKLGPSSLEKLLHSGDTWEVK